MNPSARVLIVEDEPMFQDLTRAILSIGNHHVELASDAFEALQMLGRSTFDCIVVDYHLPEMDGYAFARLVRDTARDRSEMPLLLAITGDRDGLALRRGSDSMFDAILPKPVAAKTLLTVIENALTRGREEALKTARALVNEPDDANAGEMARTFWRSAGLPDRPRIVAWPQPTAEQARALGLCFELASVDRAQALVLVGESTPSEIAAGLGPEAMFVPVASVNKIHAPFVDLEFALLDRSSWSRLATSITGAARRRAALTPDMVASSDPIDRLAAVLHVRGRSALNIDEVGAFAEGVPGLDGSALPILAEKLERLAQSNSADAGHKSKALHVDAPDPAGSPAGHVLLIEPAELMGDIIRSVLDSASHRVTLARSVPDALLALGASSPDIVVAAIEMWEAEPTLAAALDASTSQPTLLLTLGDLGQIEAAGRLGATETIERPVKPRDLLGRIERLLARSPSAPLHDPAIFDELVEQVGRDVAIRLQDKLRETLRIAEAASARLSRDEWRRDAHNLKAASGTLGFPRLAQTCAELEALCKTPAPIDAAVAALEAARTETLSLLQATAVSLGQAANA